MLNYCMWPFLFKGTLKWHFWGMTELLPASFHTSLSAGSDHAPCQAPRGREPWRRCISSRTWGSMTLVGAGEPQDRMSHVQEPDPQDSHFKVPHSFSYSLLGPVFKFVFRSLGPVYGLAQCSVLLVYGPIKDLICIAGHPKVSLNVGWFKRN